MAGQPGPVCANCRVLACEAEPGTQVFPPYCPMVTMAETVEASRRAYHEDDLLKQMAVESARVEAVGYCIATRLEETMDLAQRMGWSCLGIAHCVGLAKEARQAREVFIAHGFEVYTVGCKVGSIEKEELGLTEDDKVHPGRREILCNPVGQAAVLAGVGTELNVVMGLCVGHDSIFFLHSKAPVTVLVVKDRVLGHNPVAALYTRHSYYRRLRDE